MKIVLIDDDQDDRELFLEAIKEIDDSIEIIGLDNGQEALIHLKKESNALPDFIFLDLRMPGMSGEKCLGELKADPRLAPVPVLVYTTSNDVEESIRLKKLGAAHFMSKPTSPDEIYYLLSVVLGENWG